MRNRILFLIQLSVALACAGGPSVLGVPTVVSDTFFDMAPGITNPDEVRDLMHEKYPARFRDAGIGGRAVLLVSVDDMGEVQDASLEQGTGHGALDELALELAGILRFSPAQIGGRPIPVWVTVPINLAPPPVQTAAKGENLRDLSQQEG
jgi:TonB family protein